mmetsp:Transcript_7163/g.15807  ORF Transcript_7163/g.15807 Transcript_7163/m.15807 type:complete len:161 (+) Transcript_7163:179-661(+)
MSRSSTNHSFPITAIAFLIINLFLLLPYTQSQTTADPTCISIDSTHTYICTDTPDKTRLAVSSQHYNTNHYDLGVKQRISGSREELARIRKVMVDMENYFENEVMSRSEYEHVRGRCKNEHELCAFWSSLGECETNRGFMLSHCAAACRLCLLQATNMMA